MYTSKLLPLVSVLALLSSALAKDRALAEVKRTFDAANIPNNAQIVFNPITLLDVTFPQTTGPAVKVTPGVRLVRNQTAIPPIFSMTQTRGRGSSRPSGDFVVATVDLDAPTPQTPTLSQIRHFLGGDFVPARRSINGVFLLSNSTPAISQWRQPTPPAGSDPHRYVFLLFKQPAGFDAQTLVNATTSVQHFNISQFALDVGLGNPLGGSFILVGPDPPVAAPAA